MATSATVLYRGIDSVSYLAIPVDRSTGEVRVVVKDTELFGWVSLSGDTFNKILPNGPAGVLIARVVYGMLPESGVAGANDEAVSESKRFVEGEPVPVELSFYIDDVQTNGTINILVFP